MVSSRRKDLEERAPGTEGARYHRLDPRLAEVVTQVVRLTLEERGRASGSKHRRPDLRRLYDVPSAAAQLSLSPAKAWELIKVGRLHVVRVDGRTLVRSSELDRFAADEARPG